MTFEAALQEFTRAVEDASVRLLSTTDAEAATRPSPSARAGGANTTFKK